MPEPAMPITHAHRVPDAPRESDPDVPDAAPRSEPEPRPADADPDVPPPADPLRD